MARRVFKYALRVDNEQSLEITGFVDVLSVAVQRDELVLYAIVNPDDSRVGVVEILIRGTGHDLGQDIAGWRFLDSHLMAGGRLVWHVWMNDTVSWR